MVGRTGVRCRVKENPLQCKAREKTPAVQGERKPLALQGANNFWIRRRARNDGGFAFVLLLIGLYNRRLFSITAQAVLKIKHVCFAGDMYMKAVLLTGVRQMEIKDVPACTVEEDNGVLLKIRKVGICGSDVHYYETGQIGTQIVKYPFILGHECVGTVEAVGKKVTTVTRGQMAAVDPAVSCHQCRQCRMGRENTCYNLKFLGTPGQGDGCLREYIVMPEECCFPIDGRVTAEQGVLCEPLSIAVYAVKGSRLAKNGDAAILGAGPLGLCCLVCLKADNVNRCYMTERIESRMRMAEKAGASWVGNPDREDIVEEIGRQCPAGVDVVYECAGQQETIDQGVELLRPGGKLVIIGIPRVEKIFFNIDKLRRKEITVINVRRQNKCTASAIDLIACGKVNVDFMITHRFTLEQVQEGFELVAGYADGVVKAIIDM